MWLWCECVNMTEEVALKLAENTIPRQLQHGEFRFIRLFNPTTGKFPKAGKEPMDKGWPTEMNYAYTDAYIVKHVNRRNNYGVLPRGQMCILDVDDIEQLVQLDNEGKISFKELFQDTFTVISGHKSGNHGHYYFRTNSKRWNGKKIILTNPDTGDHLGEIYMSDFSGFVVGPNSMHDHGNKYVANDKEIVNISSRDFEKFINYFLPVADDTAQYQKRIPKSFFDSCSQSSLTSKLGLKIEDVVRPNNAIALGDGEYQGSHPIHGSTTGHNFNINTSKNVWRCFRCNSGGDPILWLAVEYGIIECSEAQPGVLDDNSIFLRLVDAMKDDSRFHDKMVVLQHEYELEHSDVDKLKRLMEKRYEEIRKYREEGVEPTSDMVKDLAAELDALNDNTSALMPEDDEDDEDALLAKLTSYKSADAKIPSKDKCVNSNDTTVTADDYFGDIMKEMESRDIFAPIVAQDFVFDCKLEKSNLIQKYVDTCKEFTDSYHEFHYASAFALLSMVVDRKAVLRLKQGDFYPNLWIFCLGTSSTSRKSTAIKRAMEFANYFNASRQLPGDFSLEALIEVLAYEPKQWLFKDEAGSLLSSIQKVYMSGARDVLCKLYDNSDYHRKLRSNKNGDNSFDIVNPYITMLFATTFDSFRRSSDYLDLTSGFLYRFLYFAPRHTHRELMPLTPLEDGDEEALDELKGHFRQLYILFMTANAPLEFRMSDMGLHYFQKWQMLREQQCNESNSHLAGSMISRLVVCAIKLAILFKIAKEDFLQMFAKYNYKIPDNFCGYIEIDDVYVIEACRMIDDYFFKSIINIASNVEQDESTNAQIKILAEIERAGGKMSKTKLMQVMHMKKKELDEHVTSLLHGREIKMTYTRLGDSRKSTTFYELIRNNSDESDVDSAEIIANGISEEESIVKEFGKSAPARKAFKAKNVMMDFDGTAKTNKQSSTVFEEDMSLIDDVPYIG